MNTPDIPIFVISLKEAKDRREYITKQLGEIGLKFQFFDAIDGRQFDVPNHPIYDRKKRLRCYGKDMNGGEIGCLLSHKAIYQKIIDENMDLVLILEDDVVLKDGFKQALEELQKIKDKFDIVRFLGSPKVARHKNRKIAHLFDDYWMVRLKTFAGGNHAYLLTKEGAQKLVNNLDTSYLPIDILVSHAWKAKLRGYIVQPGLAIQDLSFESSIGDERFNRSIDLTGINKKLYPFTRAWFKIIEAAGKSWLWYGSYFKEKKQFLINIKNK